MFQLVTVNEIIIYLKMKFLVFTAILALLSFGENFGLTNGYTTSYTLKVVEDVTLERGTTNFNYLEYLIAGFHIDYPKSVPC